MPLSNILHELSPTFGGVGFNLHPQNTHYFCFVKDSKGNASYRVAWHGFSLRSGVRNKDKNVIILINVL